MLLVTMRCLNNQKVIIDMDELKDADRMEGAVIFNRLLGFHNPGFSQEEKNDDKKSTLFKDYGICKDEWFAFIKFIRTGTTKYHLASNYIEKEEDRLNYQKLFIQELDKQESTGIFLKFGPFPSFDEYISSCKYEAQWAKHNKINNNKNNPMTPMTDIDHIYRWTSSYSQPSLPGNWEVTVPFKDGNQTEKYYRWLIGPQS